jgi:hypothetical protein
VNSDGRVRDALGFQHKDVTKLELDKETGRRYEGIDKPIP